MKEFKKMKKTKKLQQVRKDPTSFRAQFCATSGPACLGATFSACFQMTHTHITPGGEGLVQPVGRTKKTKKNLKEVEKSSKKYDQV